MLNDIFLSIYKQITNGEIWPLINCLCLFTAVTSSFLDNVTTVLLMTPVTIRLCEVMQLNPVPILMSMVIYSNIGGAVTPVCLHNLSIFFLLSSIFYFKRNI